MEVRVWCSGRKGGSRGGVQRPNGWPDGAMLRVSGKRGGLVGSAHERILVGEATTGMADLDVKERDRLGRPKGDAPDRRVKIHLIIDTHKPRLHQFSACVRWELLLFQGEVVLPSEPIVFRPRTMLDKSGARRRDGRVRSNKGTIIGVQPSARPKLPKRSRGRSSKVGIRAQEKLDGVVWVRDGRPNGWRWRIVVPSDDSVEPRLGEIEDDGIEVVRLLEVKLVVAEPRRMHGAETEPGTGHWGGHRADGSGSATWRRVVESELKENRLKGLMLGKKDTGDG